MNEPLRQRDPRVEDSKYLARIRELPCCVCGRSAPSDAAHIRMSDAAWGGHWQKRDTGMQERPSDRWALPLCKPQYNVDSMAFITKPTKKRKLIDIGCHGRQHGRDLKMLDAVPDEERIHVEEKFWRMVGKNPFMIANTLYKKFGTVADEQKSRYRKPRAKPKRAPSEKPPSRKMQSRPLPAGRKFPKRKKP